MLILRQKREIYVMVVITLVKNKNKRKSCEGSSQVNADRVNS